MNKEQILERLFQIEARAKAASPGPWREEYNSVLLAPDSPGKAKQMYDEWEKTIAANMAFVAHAREDVPWLCSLVRELLAQRELPADQQERDSLKHTM